MFEILELLMAEAGTEGGGSNATPDLNVVKAKIGDYEVDVTEEADGTLLVKEPEGLSLEQKNKFTKQAEDYALSLSAAKKKNFDLNKEREALELKKTEFEREKAEFAKSQSTAQPATASQGKLTKEELKRYWGVETIAELHDLQEDDAERYHTGVSDRAADIASQRSIERFNNVSVSSQITADGNDPGVVQAYARANGISNLASAYRFYKLDRGANNSPGGTSLAELQKRGVKILPAGTGTTEKKPPKVQTPNEMLSEVDD